MNWKLKASIQRVFAALPAGEQLYYQVQRRIGSLRQAPNPCDNLRLLEDVLIDLRNAADFRLEGKRIMEVGTGWRPEMPLFFYLLGAARVDTFDLHRYVREELALDSVAALLERETEALERLDRHAASHAEVRTRWNALRDVRTLDDFFRITNIRYHAPVDAANTQLAPGSVDLHFSYTVFEHIPRDVLIAILREASRVLDPAGGLACHHIDLSDHFAHVDPSISMVNFLQYEEAEWRKYNDNQFAYHNRLRIDEFESLYREAGHEIVNWNAPVDRKCLDHLNAGAIPLAEPYRHQPKEILATIGVRAISRDGRSAKQSRG